MVSVVVPQAAHGSRPPVIEVQLLGRFVVAGQGRSVGTWPRPSARRLCQPPLGATARWQDGSTLRALLVDFYGTLVQEDGVVIEGICTDVGTGLTEPVTTAEVSRRWAAAFAAECGTAFGPGFRHQRDLARSSLETVVEALGSRADVGQLIAAQFDYWQRPDLFSDARPFLDSLQVPVCVVSNIDRPDLEAAIAYHALEFDHIVTSDDVCSYKPRPEIFKHALDLLGVAREEAVHVGDSLTADVSGAKRAGLRAVWLNRSGRRRKAETEPWAEVAGLEGLAALLAGA
jgi:2-haloalkanoic acid dehalogenase type II